MSHQKRHFARIQWLIPCRYKISMGPVQGEIHGWGMIRNVSVRGAEMATRFPVQVGRKILLSFQVGRDNRFDDLPAKIIQIRKNGVYRFCGMDFGEKVDYAVLHKALKTLMAEKLEEV